MGNADRVQSPAELKVLARLRGICTRLPGVSEERDGFGHSTFKVAKKSLAILGEDEGKPSLAVKTDLHTQAALIKQGGFTRTPYVGQHGWVSCTGSVNQMNWKTIEELVIDAYRSSAPKKLLKELDEV
jgi:hypothetical protein